jgi:dihydrofolate reductase
MSLLYKTLPFGSAMIQTLAINSESAANKEHTVRKVVVTEFLSLDGIMEDPAWTSPYWNDEIAKFKGEETSASDALLLGRVTYQGFAAAWPQSKDEGAPYFNSVRKYVVSTTLDRVEWNNSKLIKGNIVEEITKLKQQDGLDITVHGSATLVQTLMQHDLVDCYRLLIYPVLVGKGKRLFQAGITATLKLVEARSFSSGVAALIYEPARK